MEADVGRRLSAVPKSVFRLKVSLRDVKPPVWRRLEVDARTTFGELHDLLQTAMGWLDYHLHEFEVVGQRYGDPGLLEDPDVLPESRVRLGDVLGPSARFRYMYDFGDNWLHELVVEKALEPRPGVAYPRCVGGRRACPPEDVGGPWGYAELLEVLADPRHPDHDQRRRWAGEGFDPERFDLAEVDAMVAMAAASRRRRRGR